MDKAVIWTKENPEKWEKFQTKLIFMASGALLEQARKEVIKVLNKAKEDIIKDVEGQSIPLEALSEKYAAYKASHGLDTRILISTEAYLHSLKVEKIDSNTFILHPTGSTTRGLSMESLGTMLEYGSGRLPSRPHWVYQKGPVKNEVTKKLTDLIRLQGGV